MSPNFRPILITPEIESKMDRYTNVMPDGCWEWSRYINTNGYGVVYIGGRNFYAHRASYTRFHGEIPAGLVIDHLCRNTKCLNPEHLEPVTDQENYLRGEAPGAAAQREGACRRGHPRAEYGRTYGPRTQCAACAAINMAAYKARQRAA